MPKGRFFPPNNVGEDLGRFLFSLPYTVRLPAGGWLVRPPIPYYGGKQRIAARIVGTFPEHAHYVEPFAGGLSVLLAKPPSRLETVNDLDGALVTFWRVLRDQPEELIRLCTFTPHSRQELATCRHEPLDGLSDLEVARRLWVQLTQPRAAGMHSGWRFHLANGSDPMSVRLASYVARMPAAAARLADVQIECLPAIDLIDRYGREPSALLYVDPPYLATTRASAEYRHEMGTAAEHEELAEALNQTSARVVLSGYRSELYDHLYREWEPIEMATTTEQGGSGADRVEVLWCNFQHSPHLFSVGV